MSPMDRGLQGSLLGLCVLMGCQTHNLDTVTPNTSGVQVIPPQTTDARSPVNPHINFDSLDPNANPAEFESVLKTLYLRAQTLVAENTGVDLSNIRMNVVIDEIISAEVAYETERLTDSQFTDEQFANQFLDAVMENQHGTYAALFSTRQQRVLISSSLLDGYIGSLPNNADVRRSALLALFIHELVHAADDQRYDIHDNRTLNFRASFAQSAVYEGHAQYLTRKICQQNGCGHGLKALDDFMFGRNNPPNQSTQPVQAISRNILEYSYIEGERFISALAARPDSARLLSDVLRTPPNDPIQILNPKSYPDNNRASLNQELLSVSSLIDHPWLQQPWVSVESSPLKGVNLRSDPGRRDAAIEGFTQLITAMVAMQLYDQSNWNTPPVEVTLLRADAQDTAELFGESLHQNTRFPSTQSDRWVVSLGGEDGSASESMQLFKTSERITDDQSFSTLIGVADHFVVQVTGHGMDPILAQSYLQDVMSALLGATPYLAQN